MAAPELFVDTSAWFPLVVRGHPDHRALSAALRHRVERGERVVTTNLVLAEMHALLLHRTGRPVALSFLRTVPAPPNVVVWSTPALEKRAVADWLEPFGDQDFSLADAVSFAVMAERGIANALTLDRHFVTAGFNPITSR